jgi:hypothetical protein
MSPHGCQTGALGHGVASEQVWVWPKRSLSFCWMLIK